jgi:hypothetical protein
MLVSILFSQTSLQELGKIGAFMSHFTEHKAADPEMSVVDFIVIHYFSGNVQDADYDRDMQLPFKTLDFPSAISLFTPPFAEIPNLCMPPFAVKQKTKFGEQYLPLSAHLSDIWQPPQGC